MKNFLFLMFLFILFNVFIKISYARKRQHTKEYYVELEHEFPKLFNKIDSNKDGEQSLDELKEFYKTYKRSTEYKKYREYKVAQILLNNVYKSRNRERAYGEKEHKLRLISISDKDKSGFITYVEAKYVCINHYNEIKKMRDILSQGNRNSEYGSLKEYDEKLFNTIDTNGDSIIDFRENIRFNREFKDKKTAFKKHKKYKRIANFIKKEGRHSKDFFNLCDLNSDNEISITEAEYLFTKKKDLYDKYNNIAYKRRLNLNYRKMKDLMPNAFKLLDKNGNRRVEINEFKEFKDNYPNKLEKYIKMRYKN